MVQEHHTTCSNAYGTSSVRNRGRQYGWRDGGHVRHSVVLRCPVPQIPPSLYFFRKCYGSLESLSVSFAVVNDREVEY